MSLSVFKKWGFRVLVVTAVLLLLIAVAVTVAADRTGDREVTPVTEPSFALNEADYPLSPVLQDFLDRGWKQGKPVEQTGNYVEGEGPMDLVPTGYSLTNGGSRVSAYLDVDSCRGGAEPGACPLRSLSLYGENVESFCLDGKELADVDSARITELLGEPDRVEEKPNGMIYHYSMPEKGISEITFAFPNSLDTVAQIFVVFDLAASGE